MPPRLCWLIKRGVTDPAVSVALKPRSKSGKPDTKNAACWFFCHTPPELNNAREARWRERLSPYYTELGIDPAASVPTSNRAPFDSAFAKP